MSETRAFPPALAMCPRCGKEAGRWIVRGLPSLEAMEAAEAGLVTFGGCLIESGDPDWSCRECGHEWGEPVGR